MAASKAPRLPPSAVRRRQGVQPPRARPPEHPERLRREDAELLVRVEKLYGVKLAFRADLNDHVENFKIINAVTGEEYR